MMLAFIIMIIIPIFILSVLVYSSSQYEIEQNHKASILYQLAQVDDYITTYLQGLKQDCTYLSNSPQVKNAGFQITTYMNKEMDENGVIPMRPMDNSLAEIEIFSMYERYAMTHPEVVCVYLGTHYGGYVQWPESDLERQYDPRERIWFTEIMEKQGDTMISSPYYAIASNGLVVVTVGQIIKDSKDRTIGIQAVDISLEHLTQVVEKKQVGENGFVILVDSNGIILANPRQPNTNFTNLENLISSSEYDKALNSGNVEVLLGGVVYYVNVYLSEETGWRYISFIQKNELIQSISRVGRIILLLSAVLTIICGITAYTFTQRFSSPLIHAAKQLKRIEAGDYSIDISKNLLMRDDDLGSFVKSVDAMQKVIRNLMINVEETVKFATQSPEQLVDIKEQTQCVSIQVATALEKFAKAAENEARDKLEIEKKLENTKVSLMQTQKIAQIWTWEWCVRSKQVSISEEMQSILGLKVSSKQYELEEMQAIIHPNDRKYFKRALDRMDKGDSIAVEFRYVKASGEVVWVYQTGSSIFDDFGNLTHVLVMNQDITERKETLKKLREMNANLRKMVQDEVEENRKKDAVLIYQSRLAKMGQMIGLITHQWKQPLNNLSLILANLKESNVYNDLTYEDIIECVEDSNTIISQMAQTIDDFRYFFSPNKTAEVFSMNTSVRFAIELIEESVKLNNIDIITELECTKAIQGYSNEFSQVLFNILDNAKDAMMDNPVDERSIHIKSFDVGKFVFIEIFNNGNHILPHVLDKLFEPYFTTKDDEKGTGIGLYMSKMIIEKHMQGEIKCSNVESGVMFSIKIPSIEVV